MKLCHKLGLASLALVLLSACGKEQSSQATEPDYARPVKVTQVSIGSDLKPRVLPAEVKASEQAFMSFQVNGMIEQILVRAGQHVKAGQPLAKLDPETYQEELAVAEAQFELADAVYKRSQQLVERGVISKSTFDQNTSDFNVAQAHLDQARNNLEYTELVAPYDGVIAARKANEFQYVAAKQDILILQTEDSIDVEFQLPENYIGQLRRSPQERAQVVELEVQLSGRNEWYSAVLKEVSTVADPVTASYTVVLTMPIPDQLKVVPGMIAQVKLPLRSLSSQHYPSAPSGALVEENGQLFAFRWLPEQSKVERVAIELDNGKIVSGLNDGDWLVDAGATELSDGQAAVRWVKERGL